MERSTAEAPHAAHSAIPALEPGHRYHELDWLRAFIILALVPAHAIGFFTATTSQYYSTGYSTPIGLSALMTLGTWGIGLLFLVSGAATYFAIARRSPRQYIRERVLRLLVPFLFATLTLVPLQNYLVLRAFPGVLAQIPAPPGWDAHVADSPVTFYLIYVRRYLWFLLHYTPQYEFIYWSHLWFIPRLLAISLLTLPLLRLLRAGRGERFITWLVNLCVRHRGGVFLLAAPICLVNAALGWQWQGWEVVGAPDGANVLAQFLFYTVVYVYGFVLYSDARLRQAVRRDGGIIALTLALLTFSIAQLFGVGNQALAHDFSALGILGGVLRTMAAWLCIVSLLGLSMRFFAFTNRFGRYLTEAAYPFYVLHLAVLYLVGLPLIAGGGPALLSFVVMVILTYAITGAIYHLLIRRVMPLRVLFGLRLRPSPG
jgi:glucan biosynthesis protein C